MILNDIEYFEYKVNWKAHNFDCKTTRDTLQHTSITSVLLQITMSVDGNSSKMNQQPGANRAVL